MCAVAFDTSDQEIAFVRDGNLDALIVQNPFMMGYAGVWYALAAANGVVLPHTVDSGVHVVTKENIDSPQMAGLLQPEEIPALPLPRRGDPQVAPGPDLLGPGREKELGRQWRRSPRRRRSPVRAPPSRRKSGGGSRSRPGCSAAPCCSGPASAIGSPYFLTSGNVFNMMRQVSIDAIVAYGELFTIITAGIDLSVGSVLGPPASRLRYAARERRERGHRRPIDARARPCDRGSATASPSTNWAFPPSSSRSPDCRATAASPCSSRAA